MSTAGRINKSKARFVPKRPTASGSTISRASRDPSSTAPASVTPKEAHVPLPPVGEEDPTLSQPRPPRAATKPPHAPASSSPASSFGPSDPSVRVTQACSSPEPSPPPSSFAFTPRDPTATPATSVAYPSQAASQHVDPSSSQASAFAGEASTSRLPPASNYNKSSRDKTSRIEERVAEESIDDAGSRIAGATTKKGTRSKGKERAQAPEELDSDHEDGDALDLQVQSKQSRTTAPANRSLRTRTRNPPIQSGRDDHGSPDRADGSGDGLDPGMDESDELEDGEAELAKDARPAKRRKNAARKEADAPLPTVDPSQTTMSQLADPNLKFDVGRPSERTLFFEQQKIDKKTAMKLKRQKMKERQKRIADGGASGEDEDEDDRDDRTRTGEDTDPQGVSGGRPRNTSPQALDAAEAMALIGATRSDQVDDPEGADTDENGDTDKDEEKQLDSAGKVGDRDEGEAEDEEDYSDLIETSYAPQMRIINGELVVDIESLEIDRSKPTDTGPREVIEESAQDRFVNSRSFSKKPGKAKKWTAEETDRFYDALSQFGTDFELISALFPGRSRREIKLKWTKEDKINSKKITAALMQRKKIDLDSYSKLSGQDLSGPAPLDPMDEIRRRRAKLEAEGHVGGGQRRGGDSGGHASGEQKGKSKRKRGPIDEAGAALFDESALALEQEAAERRRMEEEQAEEERQAMIDAMEAEED
ncbi:transcription factor TFIIIB subunit BDP1 [Sporobolomyces koalae]|uniref:transcription factor TFIIIB subunit BDP1 n=1 Tax=Sporobolomyces koalae TaxID=500713 RepID=UPI003177D4AF